VRYHSHDTLPENEQNVTVHHLLLCKPIDGDSWDNRNRKNTRILQNIVEKYRVTTETSEVVLHMNATNRLFFYDVVASMRVPVDSFRVETHSVESDDYNIYVKVFGGLALFMNSENEYDDVYTIQPPSTNISVDEMLHKIATRKQYIIQQHLLLLRQQHKWLTSTTSAAATTTVSSNHTKKQSTSSNGTMTTLKLRS
jgi:hypothetical protein